jgi:hypothetical protein
MAKGLFKFGNVRRNLSAWGYNSVDTLFETIITRAETEDWSRIGFTLDAVRKRLEGDTDIQWAGKFVQKFVHLVEEITLLCMHSGLILVVQGHFD